MKTDRDIEKEYSVQDFIAELRRLADTLESGEQYGIELGDEKVTVPGHALFAIEHESEDGHHEIEFQLSWSDDEETDEDEDEAEEIDEEAVA